MTPPAQVASRSGHFSLVHTQEQQTWVSPTLPPQVIAQYQSVLPDAPERFFQYMEREQANRHALQTKTVTQITAVQRYTFYLSAIGIIGACIVTGMGHAAGLAVAFTALLPLVQGVWQRHKESKQESEQKTLDAKRDD